MCVGFARTGDHGPGHGPGTARRARRAGPSLTVTAAPRVSSRYHFCAGRRGPGSDSGPSGQTQAVKLRWSRTGGRTQVVKFRWSNTVDQTQVVKPRWSNSSPSGQTQAVKFRWSNSSGQEQVVEHRWSNPGRRPSSIRAIEIRVQGAGRTPSRGRMLRKLLSKQLSDARGASEPGGPRRFSRDQAGAARTE